MNYDFKKILSEFKVSGEFICCKPCGDGHINDTFMAKFDEGGAVKKYIVGKMNKSLFTDVEKLMSNIRLVTEFTRKKIKERGGDPDRESVTIVYTKDGESYKYFEEYGEYFRVYLYLAVRLALEVEINSEIFAVLLEIFVTLAVLRVDDSYALAVGVAAALFYLFAGKFGDEANVAHQFFNVGKKILVHFSDDVFSDNAAVVELRHKSIVYVSVAAGFTGDKLALDLKFGEYFLKIVVHFIFLKIIC